MSERVVYVPAPTCVSTASMVDQMNSHYCKVNKTPSPELQRKCTQGVDRKRSGPIWSDMYNSMDELVSAACRAKNTTARSRNDAGHAADISHPSSISQTTKGEYHHLSPSSNRHGTDHPPDIDDDQYDHIYDILHQDVPQSRCCSNADISDTQKLKASPTVYVPVTPPQGRRAQSDALPAIPLAKYSVFRPHTPDMNAERNKVQPPGPSAALASKQQVHPRNVVQKPSTLSGSALADQCWFHGGISRRQAESRLCDMVHQFNIRRQNWDGVYLVRERKHDKEYVVSVARNIPMGDGTNKVQCEHHMLTRDDGPKGGVVINGAEHYAGLKTVVSVVRALGRVRTMCLAVTKRNDLLCKMPCLRKP
eukprot:m.115070 g.115070  ORF g.115070 m.115070 type:complete len:364 (+) comp17135_c0_seq1:161-1252(+)